MKYVAGTGHILGGVALGAVITANTPYHIKLRVEDVPATATTARKVEIGMKVWAGTMADEPAAFSTFSDAATATIALPDIGGWTGPGLFGNTERFYYTFRMATGGASAPTSAATGGITATAAGTLPKLTGSSTATATVPAYTATATGTLPKLAGTSAATAAGPAFTATATGTLPKLTGTSQASAITTAVTNLVPDGGTAPAGFTVFGAADAGLALASNDGDTSYVENSGKTTGSFFVTLSDPPADFVKAISANLKVTLRRV